jgi:Glyoxalase-like domain
VASGVAWAVEAGATLASYQPQEHVRALLDPAGHPLCLFQGAVGPPREDAPGAAQ